MWHTMLSLMITIMAILCVPELEHSRNLLKRPIPAMRKLHRAFLLVFVQFLMFKWQLLAKHYRSIFLDSVENVKPHGTPQQLGSPFDLQVNVGFGYRCMTEIFGNVSSHFGPVLVGFKWCKSASISICILLVNNFYKRLAVVG